MAGRDATCSNLKKRLVGVLLPMLLVAVSIGLGLILTGFFIGEKGSAKNQPEARFADSTPLVGTIKGADKAILLAEVDPIDQLLSTPSPYDNLTGVTKERTKPTARAKQKTRSGATKPARRPDVSITEESFHAADKGETGEGSAERTYSVSANTKGGANANTNADSNGDSNGGTNADRSEGSDSQASGEAEAGNERRQGAEQETKQGKGAQGAGGKSKETPVHLFNTVSLFPKPITAKTAPQWHRVVKTQSTPPPIFSNGTAKRMPPNVAKRWFALREKIVSGDDFAKAKAVNTFFNTWPYRTDDVVWGVPEYWATPEEFLEKSGDCEDYAITKYYAMRSLGVSADKLRVVAVKDTIRGIGHAVLAIFINDKAYILDNLSPYVLEHTVLKNYRPQFSVNEHYRWGHARIVKKK